MDRNLIMAILIAIIVIGALVIALPSFDGVQDEGPVQTPVITPTPPTEPTQAPPMRIDCGMCHQGTERLAPHIEGGDYCRDCHGSSDTDVHMFHPSQGCKDCHSGMPPKVPMVEEGQVSCELCHAYPDASEPSYGNLVNIHIPRGLDCQICHIGEISEIHNR